MGTLPGARGWALARHDPWSTASDPCEPIRHRLRDEVGTGAAEPSGTSGADDARRALPKQVLTLDVLGTGDTCPFPGTIAGIAAGRIAQSGLAGACRAGNARSAAKRFDLPGLASARVVRSALLSTLLAAADVGAAVTFLLASLADVLASWSGEDVISTPPQRHHGQQCGEAGSPAHRRGWEALRPQIKVGAVQVVVLSRLRLWSPRTLSLGGGYVNQGLARTGERMTASGLRSGFVHWRLPTCCRIICA